MTYEEMIQELNEFLEMKEAYLRGEIDDGMSEECRENWIEKCNA